MQFQSTLSVRRATESRQFDRDRRAISIHALREESDNQPVGTAGRCDISIHALREESDPPVWLQFRPRYISIHALREESDEREYGIFGLVLISIHALREESDPAWSTSAVLRWNFNPRSP